MDYELKEKAVSTDQLRQTHIETLTYRYKDGFMVDIVKPVKEGIGDLWDVWLYHEDYGYKEYLFGIPMNTDLPATLESVLEQIADNLETETYIEDYRAEFMNW